MIQYKSEEELMFAKHYATKLNDELSLAIFNNGKVNDKGEAIHISQFFWKMVDASIKDKNSNVESPWVEGAEYLTEKIMYSISGYLERAGFSEEWENISDEQDAQ